MTRPRTKFRSLRVTLEDPAELGVWAKDAVRAATAAATKPRRKPRSKRRRA